jgi:hypothetical protein
MADNADIIKKIIQNNTKPYFSSPAKVFVSKYWQPLLEQVANLNGTDSPAWRKAVKMLTDLAVYMDPSIKQQHANVDTVLLPKLVNTMKLQVEALGASDPMLDKVIKDLVSNNESGSSEAIAPATALASEPETTPTPTDSDAMAFDITADDLPSAEVKEREEFEHGNTVDFESFQLDTPAETKPEASETADEEDLSLDMESFDLDTAEPAPVPAEPEPVLETPSLDDEPLELDLSDAFEELETAEEPAPVVEEEPEVDQDLGLPPLELDLSDFEDDLDKPK